MFLWRLLRWLTSVMRRILLLSAFSGRLSHRLALFLMLLVLAIECLPATNPLRGGPCVLQRECCHDCEAVDAAGDLG